MTEERDKKTLTGEGLIPLPEGLLQPPQIHAGSLLEWLYFEGPGMPQ